jgi:hypothetical protein
MTGKVRFSAVLVKPVIFIPSRTLTAAPISTDAVGTATQVPAALFSPRRR